MARPGQVAAKQLRPGDWVYVAGTRHKVEEVLDEPPTDAGACISRPDNVWLRLSGLSGVTAILREELVRAEVH